MSIEENNGNTEQSEWNSQLLFKEKSDFDYIMKILDDEKDMLQNWFLAITGFLVHYLEDLFLVYSQKNQIIS
ncbi:MAG: hypothetical protein ACXAC7_21960 [Candidatus Hodarchaeales archaeon]|jgi:hypothetical protein